MFKSSKASYIYSTLKHFMFDTCLIYSIRIFLSVYYVQLTTGVTSGAGTAYPSGAPEFTPGFKWGSCYAIFSFLCMFCSSLFVLFLLTIVLSVLLRYTDSDCPCCIFKLFLYPFKIDNLYSHFLRI